jgi:hypothetical protein
VQDYLVVELKSGTPRTAPSKLLGQGVRIIQAEDPVTAATMFKHKAQVSQVIKILVVDLGDSTVVQLKPLIETDSWTYRSYEDL